MNLLGIGSLFSGGLGVDALEAALEQGWCPPQLVAAADGGSMPVYQVNLENIADRSLLKKIRRADKLSKMSVLAAAAALADSGIDTSGKRVGIILSTALGAHVTTFDFLDGIIDYGEANVSPTAFSNSVHNAAASYISSTLDITGPTLSVTAFRFSFETALQLANCWLEQGRADYLLVGAVEQYGEVLGHVSRKMLQQPADGRLQPFSLSSTGNIPGEGALFFLVGKDNRAGAYCRIGSTVAVTDLSGADLVIINSDGSYADESGYLEALPAGKQVSAYSPLFGSIMTGAAFNLAAGALMLKRQKLYAAPQQENPHGLNIVSVSVPAAVETICSLNMNCSGEQVAVSLRRMNSDS